MIILLSRFVVTNQNRLIMENFNHQKLISKTGLLTIFTVCCISFADCQLSAQNTENSRLISKIRVASCQFSVSSDITANFRFIKDQMIEASLKKADVVHFAECALSGYPGVDIQSLDNFNWNKLHRMTDSVSSLAKELNIWVILGSLHKLGGNYKPYNCLYVINPEGKLIDRYDKRFCTSTDLKYCRYYR